MVKLELVRRDTMEGLYPVTKYLLISVLKRISKNTKNWINVIPLNKDLISDIKEVVLLKDIIKSRYVGNFRISQKAWLSE